MTERSLAGRTVVAAVAEPRLAVALADRLSAAGALLAVACPDPAVAVGLNERGRADLIAFAVTPADPGAWERMLAHVEQRLGPIDGLVLAPHPADGEGPWPQAAARVTADMATRGTGAVVTVGTALKDSATGPVRRAEVAAGGDPATTAAAVAAALL